MKKILLLVLFLIQSSIILAQNAEIRGFIYDKTTGEPMIFSTVFLKGTKYGISTDVNGFYALTKLPAGTYTLVATTLGYDTIKSTITLAANDRITKNLIIAEKLKTIGEVEIISTKQTEDLIETRTSVNKISLKDIKQLPSVGGEPDLAQYIQVLPGVVFTGDQGGQLYIRGGSPIQNKVILDGMTIYNPFHSIGLYSVLDADIIRNADVYTGGFGAEYGGRISAIMDITTRDGNKKRLAGKITANPFAGKILLEGPLGRNKEGNGSQSFLISAKNLYLNKTSKILYSYADTAGLPYSFTDVYAKVSLNGSNGGKINFFGFNFTDDVDYAAPANLKWKSSGAGTNFVAIPSSSSTLITGNFAFSQYEIGLKEASSQPRSSLVSGFNTALAFTTFPADDEVKYGIEISGFKTNFLFTNASNTTVKQEDFTTELATYVKYKIKLQKFIIEPSFRGHYYASLSELSPEPRLSFKYLITDYLRFKAAAGLYAQNFLSATSDRDVVNLFYGFLSSPESTTSTIDGKKVNTGLQKAKHLIVGNEINISRTISVNIEAYVKLFSPVANINRDKIYPENQANNNKPEVEKKDFILEKGTAKGIDFSFNYTKGKFNATTNYSLASVNRNDGTRTYRPVFDRRHNINAFSAYTFGRKDDIEIGARINIGSGFPFTQTQGFYSKNNFQDGSNTDYTQNNGDLTVVYAELNAARLPWYHRLDINIKKTYVLSKYQRLEINLGATNLYNRKNIFYFDRISNTRKNQLPIIPTLGINYGF